MKRRFFAMFLASGLVMGLCGCGNAGASSTPEPAEGVVSEAQEEASAQDSDTQASNSAGEAMPDSRYLGDYSVDELIKMLSSGEITITDVESNVATGDVSYEDYEGILNFMSPTQETTAELEQNAISTEANEHIGNTDVSSLLTTHVMEYEDQDGYKIRETCQLSPIFTEDDSDAMYSLWKALGNDVESFPDEGALYEANYLLRDARDTCSCNELEYIIGTYTVENFTDGFPITANNPRTYTGKLVAKQVSAFDEEQDGDAANFFNLRSAVAIVQLDSTICHGEKQAAPVLSVAKMQSDTWGPVSFVIALPNGATPNRPEGYHYDNIQLVFSPYTSFLDDYEALQLTYFR